MKGFTKLDKSDRRLLSESPILFILNELYDLKKENTQHNVQVSVFAHCNDLLCISSRFN